MFIQSCFIRKSPDMLRAQLEDLGYKLFGTTLCEDYCIFTIPQYGRYRIEVFSNITDENTKGFIDCGTNENLFLAIAALRDDSDYMQYFVSNNDPEMFLLCCYKEFHCLAIDPDNAFNYCDYKDEFHKATIEELIERFKK